MSQSKERFCDKPTTVDEFVRCVIWPGWNPFVAFDNGSRNYKYLKPELIRAGVRALRKRTDLCRYTFALTKLIRLSDDDKTMKAMWQSNLPLLRAPMYTSAWGTERQRAKLIEIAGNKRVVSAMRFALRQEHPIDPRIVEPSWIAVLYAEGSDASIKQANRFNAFLEPEDQEYLRNYRNH